MKKFLSFLITGSVLLLLVIRIVDDWDTVVSFSWNLSFSSVVVLVGSLLLIYFVNILSWHYIVLLLKEKISLKDNSRIWLLSNLTRLLPGGIWQYPSRVLLLNKEGVTKQKGTYAVTLEIVFSLLIGASTVFLTLPFWSLPQKVLAYRPYMFLFLIVPFVVFIILFNENYVAYFTNIFSKITKRKLSLKQISFDHSKLFPTIILFFLRFIVVGFSFYLLVSMLVSAEIGDSISLIGMYAFSWLAGFVVIFAPGGIGVTEGVLALVLSIYMPASVAASIAIIFRLLLIATEGILIVSVQSIRGFSKSQK